MYYAGTKIIAPCPTLDGPNFGSVIVHYNSTINLFVAEYSCEDDFMVVGDSKRYCQCLENGKWSGREPYCIAGIALYNCVYIRS